MKTQRFPDFPPFSGGVLDAWPNWAVEALSIADIEHRRVRDFVTSESKRHG